MSAVGDDALLTINDVAANVGDNECVGAAPEAGNLVPNTGAGNGSGDPLITCTVAAAPVGEQRVEAGGSDMLHGLG